MNAWDMEMKNWALNVKNFSLFVWIHLSAGVLRQVETLR